MFLIHLQRIPQLCPTSVQESPVHEAVVRSQTKERLEKLLTDDRLPEPYTDLVEVDGNCAVSVIRYFLNTSPLYDYLPPASDVDYVESGSIVDVGTFETLRDHMVYTAITDTFTTWSALLEHTVLLPGDDADLAYGGNLTTTDSISATDEMSGE